MKKYLFIESDARVAELNADGGICKVSFVGKDAERLYRASRGLTLDACAVMVGKYVVFKYIGGDNRFLPVRECFTAGEWEKVKDGSFNATAIAHFCPYNFISLSTSRAVCLSCGCSVAVDSMNAHVCGERLCRCGNVLKTDDEKRESTCEKCARERVRRIYSYHNRTHRERPAFERPNDRVKEAHLGVELEAAGGGDFCANNDNAAKLYDILNADENAFTPVAEFETDASIENGIESITRPLTFNGFKKRAAKFQKFYEHIKSVGGEFGEVNGLHVHIDRDFFGERGTEERTKAAILIELMVYKFFDFFALISRRRAGCFGYAHKKESVNGLTSAFLNIRDQEHSYAVNGSGGSTVELRIFGGKIDNADDLPALFCGFSYIIYHAHARAHTHAHARTRAHTHARTRTHTHAHARTRTHTHAYFAYACFM